MSELRPSHPTFMGVPITMVESLDEPADQVVAFYNWFQHAIIKSRERKAKEEGGDE